MPSLSDTVAKLFQTSKMVIYFDGDPIPYAGTVTIPKIVSEMIEYDNTSIGGKIEFADPFRRGVDGTGTIVFDQDTSEIISKISDSSKVVNMTVTTAVAAISTDLGSIAPLPQKYSMSVQFSEYDPGEIAPGKKREVTATFNMYSLKVTSAGIDVIDYNFLSGSFKNNGVDLLSAVNALLPT